MLRPIVCVMGFRKKGLKRGVGAGKTKAIGGKRGKLDDFVGPYNSIV
jgi:hypothetical protein